jgi:pimeloyl-ACP methyl ester carboxylesterase
VQETGNPAGKPILFIHGFSQCCFAWGKQMKSDLADTFRLTAVDIRGHGLSDKPGEGYGDSKLWAEDIHAVINQLELNQPLLTAWSYGGAVISDYIADYGEDEISGTHWVGAVCRLGEALQELVGARDDFAAVAAGLFSEYVGESVAAMRRLIGLVFPSGLSPEETYLFLGWNMAVPPYVREGLLSRTLDRDAVVRKMKKPMLLTWGEEDVVVPPSMRDHLASLAPHAGVSDYPGVGHAPFWEASERFNRELRKFREAI